LSLQPTVVGPPACGSGPDTTSVSRESLVIECIFTLDQSARARSFRLIGMAIAACQIDAFSSAPVAPECPGLTAITAYHTDPKNAVASFARRPNDGDGDVTRDGRPLEWTDQCGCAVTDTARISPGLS
jgi:hypothetical protein